jgi:ABC-type antimicrobial peptide transport system permease subunit
MLTIWESRLKPNLSSISPALVCTRFFAFARVQTRRAYFLKYATLSGNSIQIGRSITSRQSMRFYPIPSPSSVIAVLLGTFALLALTLAAIGVYGLLPVSSHSARERDGVRMAVGSSRANILLLMLREAAAFTGIGVVAGLIVAFAGAHLASALLFQTSSADGVSICVSVSALLIIAILAAVFPASRAASINPVEALRSE